MAASTEVAGKRRRKRVTKDPGVRRDELLDVAWELCRRDGFDAMSVDQLTQAAGVAKGTFYHYFASKDAMLEALVQRFGERLFEQLSAAMATVSGNGEQRLRALMEAAAGYKIAAADLAYATFLYSDSNIALRHRLFAAWRERAREVLAPVMALGQADGSLDVVDVDGTTGLVLLLWFDAADQLWERALRAPDTDAFVAAMLGGGRCIYRAQERILGVPDGSYTLPDGPEVVDLIHKLHASLEGKKS